MTEKDTIYYNNGSFSTYLDNYVYFNWRVVYFSEFTCEELYFKEIFKKTIYVL